MLGRMVRSATRPLQEPALLKIRGQRFLLLDAARGFAAFAVLIFHYRHFFYPVGARSAPNLNVDNLPLSDLLLPFYQHGDWAVPAFWIISGFVFAAVYVGSSDTTRQFFGNRFARLYPLHLLTLVIVALLQLVAEQRFGTSLIYDGNTPQNFLKHLAFASNWTGREFSFNAPIWSVSIEVLIYAVFWASHRWLWSRGVVFPLLAVGVFGVVMVGVKQVAIGECGFYFFFGVTLHYCFVAHHDRPRFTLFIATAMFFAGVAALLQTTILSVALAGMFGGGILLLCLAEPFVSSRFHRILANIGNNTYGMYLWHIPIQLALFLTVPALIESATRSAWFLLSYLALVCVVARIGYLHFERPASLLLRRYGQGRSRHCQAG